MNGWNFDVDLGEVDADTRKALMDLYTVRACELAARCENERAMIGRQNRSGHRAINGMGAQTSGIHPFDYFGQPVLHGADRRDEEFWRWFTKHNDYAQVTSGGTRLQISCGGISSVTPRGRRFHKVYS